MKKPIEVIHANVDIATAQVRLDYVRDLINNDFGWERESKDCQVLVGRASGVPIEAYDSEDEKAEIVAEVLDSLYAQIDCIKFDLGII